MDGVYGVGDSGGCHTPLLLHMDTTQLRCQMSRGKYGGIKTGEASGEKKGASRRMGPRG